MHDVAYLRQSCSEKKVWAGRNHERESKRVDERQPPFLYPNKQAIRTPDGLHAHENSSRRAIAFTDLQR